MFCWSELLLYNPFSDIDLDIGLSTENMVQNSRNFRYLVWHVDRSLFPNEGNEEDFGPLIHEDNVD